MLGANIIDAVLENLRARRIACLRDVLPRQWRDNCWADLNHALQWGRLTHPRVRLIKEGTLLPSNYIDYYSRPQDTNIPRINAPALYEQLSDGATLILDSVEEYLTYIAPMLGLISGRARSFSQANAFLCFCASPGLGIHRDDHDVVVLQLAGEKHWTVFDRTESLEEAQRAGAVFDDILHAGDLLVVPEGAWHDVRGVNTASLHISAGFFRASPAAVAKFALETTDPASDNSKEAYETGVAAAQASLSRIGLIEAYLSTRDRPAFSLPFAVTGQGPAEGRIVKPGSSYFRIAEADTSDHKYLIVGSLVAQVSTELASDLEPVFTYNGCAYDQLVADAISPEYLANAIADLICAGVLVQQERR